MKRGNFSRQEERNAVLAICAALLYLASAVINPLYSVAIFILIVAFAAALYARSHSAKETPAPVRNN